MAKYSDVQRLQIILKDINEIYDYTQKQKLTAGEIENRRDLKHTLPHLIQNIGEMCYKLSPDITGSYTFVPWKQIAGARHCIVHDYQSLNYNIIADIVNSDLQSLEMCVTVILKSGGHDTEYHTETELTSLF